MKQCWSINELDALQADVDALKRLQAETATELDAFQNRMTSLTTAPEPLPLSLAVAGLVAADLFQLAKRRGWSCNQVRHTPTPKTTA